MPFDMPSEMGLIRFGPGAASPPPELAPPYFTTGAKVHGTPASQDPSIYYSDKFLVKYNEVDTAIRKRSKEDLCRILEEDRKEKEERREEDLSRINLPGVNLSGDPLLSVLVAYGETELVDWLVPQLSAAELLEGNRSGDTGLHVAATKGDSKAAEAIVEHCYNVTGNNEILEKRNKQWETALHKAALYGKKDMFWKLVDLGSDPLVREKDGASVLHCAILGNAFELAREITRTYPELKYYRMWQAVTPLQLIVTTPKAFRSREYYGPLESLIYDWIPLKDMSTSDRQEDIENPSNHEASRLSQENLKHVAKNDQGFYLPLNCDSCLSLGKGIQVFIFSMLKKAFSKINQLERHKRRHEQALELITLLAADEIYWSFLMDGKRPEPESSVKNIYHLGYRTCEALKHIQFLLKEKSLTNSGTEVLERNENIYKLGANIFQVMKLITLLAKEENYRDHGMIEDMFHEYTHMSENDIILQKKEDNKKTRWEESPLILGARMGLHEFVRQIVTIRPEAALLPDSEGKNFLQVAIQHGHEEIVEIVESLTTGNNPKLPSSWLASCDERTNNTILHFAAEKTVNEEEASAFQMQHELQWFEKVRKLVPKDLKNSRNRSEKTAQELFTENHKGMIKKSKDQTMQMGKTCASMVAAVVFASSFSIPGERINNNVPAFHNKVAFKIFANAYILGLSCASTAMVLFLSLLSASYKEQDFRRAIPTKYFWALMSFFLALLLFLVAFSCNIYLNTYGYRRAEVKELIPFICELIIFPILSFSVLFYRGARFRVGLRIWR